MHRAWYAASGARCVFRKLRLCSLSILFILVRFPSFAARSSQDPIAPAFDAVFSHLADANSPGIAVLVRKERRTVFERGYRARELHYFAQIDPQYNFRLDPDSKQFNTMLIITLGY